MAKTLYICYFGVREPLVQTQVIPYLREIEKDGHNINLLTFEPDFEQAWTAQQIEKEKQKLAEIGIEWYCLAYHKRFSAIATAYDVFCGTRFIRRMISEKKIDILHGRVHVPTLMGALARKFSKQKPKLLFDIRGFFPEEYTDAGIWPENGLLYRIAKKAEKWLMKEADGFVVLTEKAREILFPESALDVNTVSKNPVATAPGSDRLGRPVEVIPCCVDLKRFESANDETRTEMRKKLGIEERFVTSYVGAFGGWYLTKETADFFGELRAMRPDAFAMILTQSKPEIIEPLLRQRGYADGDYLITQARPNEIPAYLSAADAAVSFIKRCYSKQASSPTKNAEYLACGLPIITNSGVGDVDKLITENDVGALVENLDAESYKAALDKITELGNIGGRCREVARREFDLEKVGGVGYRRIYSKIVIKN